MSFYYYFFMSFFGSFENYVTWCKKTEKKR